jgi:hypothetical protein
MTEIMKLKEQVDLQTLKFEKYLIDDSKKITRNDSKHETEISKSFYLVLIVFRMKLFVLFGL